MKAKGTVLGPRARTPAPTACGRRTPTARPEGGQPGEGKRLNSDTPHNGERHPPRGRPSATPTSRIKGSQGVGPVLGPHAHTNRTQHIPVAKPRPPVPEDGRQGKGQRRTPDAPRNGGRPPPPGTTPLHPRNTQPYTGHASQRDSAGPPHWHTRAHSTRVAGPGSRPRRWSAGGGEAPELRRSPRLLP